MNTPEAARPVPAGNEPSLRALNAIFGLLAAALCIGALYVGRDLIVPLVLAVLLAFVLAPIVVLLRRAWVPQALAVVLAVLISAAATLGIGVVMARQAGSLASGLPAYQANLQSKLQGLRLAELMADATLALQKLRDMISGGAAERGAGVAMPAPLPAAAAATPLDMIQSLAGPVLGPLATAGVVVLFAIFVLLYREDLRDRVIRLAGSRDLHRTTMALNDAAGRLSRLFLAQVGMNTLLGVLVGLALWAVGLPSPALWGFLAGLMRFVPFFGTAIALLPPLVLAVAVDPGWSMAFWVLGLFLVAEPLMGQVLEPAVYGRSTGLSPVAVIIAATFWTFMWGPIGLLLATPLTVCLVVLGRHVPRLGFLDVMLGDRPSLLPQESFYQRALERDGAGLLAQARRHLKQDASLTAYHDGVALRALVLADQDWARDILEPERLEHVRGQVRALLGELSHHLPLREEEAAAPPPAIVCTGGRGRLDDLAAGITTQALQSEGMAALALPETPEPEPATVAGVRLCCLSVLEEGSSAASVRYLVKRWQRRLPEARIVIGLWHVSAESPMLAELRQDAAGEAIVTSLGELAALCRAIAPRVAAAA